MQKRLNNGRTTINGLGTRDRSLMAPTEGAPYSKYYLFNRVLDAQLLGLWNFCFYSQLRSDN